MLWIDFLISSNMLVRMLDLSTVLSVPILYLLNAISAYWGELTENAMCSYFVHCKGQESRLYPVDVQRIDFSTVDKSKFLMSVAKILTACIFPSGEGLICELCALLTRKLLADLSYIFLHSLSAV